MNRQNLIDAYIDVINEYYLGDGRSIELGLSDNQVTEILHTLSDSTDDNYDSLVEKLATEFADNDINNEIVKCN